MTRLPPPLRFLVGLCAGWTCARAGILASAAWSAGPPLLPSAPREIAAAGPAAATGGSSPFYAPPGAAAASDVRAAGAERVGGIVPPPVYLALQAEVRSSRAKSRGAPSALAPATPVVRADEGRSALALAGRPSTSLGTNEVRWIALAPSGDLQQTPLESARAPPGRRWSLAAWAFVRRGTATPLAPGGTLGGSQAGARGTYRIAGVDAPFAVSLRVTTPLASARGAEAAMGLDWKPVAGLPVHLLVERRQRLGPDGRSAFGATVYGGGEAKLGPVRVDGYAQAGIVGLKRRDLFADGGVRAAIPLGPLRLGAGAWAAAQPGIARVDVGPHAALRLPLPGGAVVAVDWRFRVAGNARPGSGPAFTLAADF